MKISNIVLILFLLLAQITLAQTSSREIQGQIYEQSNLAEGVNIVNNTSQVTSVSDINGLFSILAKEGDVLVFSSINLNPLKLRITEEDLKTGLLQIKMTVKETELKEVIINENQNITAENLGIIPKGQKKYTPAERKLATAGDFKPIALLGLLGGSLDIDPIINKINGRTKKLKTNVEIEKKEHYIEQLGYWFEEEYYVEYLKIPSEYIRGFRFYIVEKEYARILLKEKNKSKLALLMSELALKYKEIIASETK